jgi:signal transduction histidine kinase
VRREKKVRRTFLEARYLGLVFGLAVILPSCILAGLSIRAAAREESFIEGQLRTTLLAEATHAAALASDAVRQAAEDLRASVPAIPADPSAAVSRWKAASPLVDVPFLLSPRYAILWPPAAEGLAAAERSFLEENAGFLSDRTPTQVFRNIALVYQNEILEKAPSSPGTAAAAAGSAAASAAPPADAAPDGALASAAPVAARTEAPPAASRGGAAPAASPVTQLAKAAVANSPAKPAAATPRAASSGPAEDEASRSGEGALAGRLAERQESLDAKDKQRQAPPEAKAARTAVVAQPPEAKALRAAPPAAASEEAAAADVPPETRSRRDAGDAQKALDTFAQSQTVRESVYAEAAKKGDSVGKRVVAPAPQAQNSPAEEQRSELVSEPVRLSRIAAGSPYGIIPRFVGERLTFLFYMRLADGRIAGCRVDAGGLRARVSGVVAGTWTPARILVILDEKGTPLAAPPGSAGRDWRRPFVSREIGESLPRWEAASYLTDPSAVAARARTSALLIALLVVILLASVAGGGVLVLTSLASEARLARNKATFVTNVSHELKTPLTSIRLFVDLLRQGRQRDPARAGEYLERIGGETERLTRLINSVLDFSALERGVKRYTRARVDLAELCRGTVEAERPRLSAGGFTVSLIAPPEPVVVEADGEAIRQVLLNLLSNAEKYSPAEREISVEVSRGEGVARLDVRDRGAGVPERLRERIFQEFFRADDSLTARVKGTGLGLTIARRIARDHGGDVICGPREGGGSTFSLTLPHAGPGEGERE